MVQEIQGSEIINFFESWSPKSLAYEWDNVGLQVGSLNKNVQKMMITLDVMENVVDEAIENNVDLVIAHHPLLFKPLKEINAEEPVGRIIQKLLKHDITVYAAHTNLDITDGGVNDALTKKLDITNTEVLTESYKEKMYKLVVFVPLDYAESVREAIGNADAGHIGNYSHCTFESRGQGTFKPLKGTSPFLGKRGELERVNEVKLETIIPQANLAEVLSVMVKSHPYEEPAYDLIPLANEGNSVGVGRVGYLTEAITLEAFCEGVKTALNVPALRVVGDLKRQVKRIAVLGGSGEKNIPDCIRKGADVYLTGDMTFHQAQEAWQRGLSIVDPGHHVEKIMKETVKNYLERALKETDADVDILISESNTEPFQFI